jgi:hypothetical protein
MTLCRILFAIVIFAFAPAVSQAQAPFNFQLRHNIQGTHNYTNWVLRGTRAVRLTSLNLNYVPTSGRPVEYHLKGQVRWEDAGLWNVNAYRISPGKYKVWFSRKGARNWFQYWTIPVMRIRNISVPAVVTHLSMTRQFPLGRLEGRVRFNATIDPNLLHWATLQPKR